MIKLLKGLEPLIGAFSSLSNCNFYFLCKQIVRDSIAPIMEVLLVDKAFFLRLAHPLYEISYRSLYLCGRKSSFFKISKMYIGLQ